MFLKHLNTNKIHLDKYEISLKKLKLFEEKNKKLKKEINETNFLKKKTFKQLGRLQEMGLLVGEIIKSISDTQFIIKAPTGTRYLVGAQNRLNKINLTSLTRIALDSSTLTIMKILKKKIDPSIDLMLKESPGKICYEDIGGLKKRLQQLREIIELPLFNPEIFFRVGVKIPKGVLLYGPPGTGKTLLARGVACNLKCTFLKIVASSIVDKYIGESARIIREIFLYSKNNCPSVIFIDEIDAIGGKRFSEGSSADREIQRTLMELLNQLDGFENLVKVKIIMATNRPDVLDPALLRPGRLDRKLLIPLPSFDAKLHIFKIYFKKIKQKGKIEIEKIIKICKNFNGADLRNICTEAGLFAIRDERDYIKEKDLIKAAKKIFNSKKLDGTIF
nr:tRNA-splicing endonuclease subunit Sen2 [Cryptomonas curvata]